MRVFIDDSEAVAFYGSGPWAGPGSGFASVRRASYGTVIS